MNVFTNISLLGPLSIYPDVFGSQPEYYSNIILMMMMMMLSAVKYVIQQ